MTTSRTGRSKPLITTFTGRTKPTTTFSQITRPRRFKEYLMWIFTDNLRYNITDENWNRIVIYDTTWYEEVDNNIRTWRVRV